MVIGVLSTAFIICTLPLTYMYISSIIERPKTTMLMDISYISAFNNSLLNPLLYMFLTGARKDFAAKFSCCKTAKGIYKIITGDFLNLDFAEATDDSSEETKSTRA